MFTATFQLFAQQTVQTPTTFAPMGGIAVGSLNSSGAAYAHIIQATPQPIACTTGPSTGQCGWFGDWELIYADIHPPRLSGRGV